MSTIGRLRNKGALRRILFLALMGVGHVASAAAQEVVAFPLPGEAIYEVRLTDGSLIYGRVTDVSGDRVSITTSAGVELDLQRSQIRQLSAAEGRFVDGEFWREDPNGTRLFFTATGRAIPAGEAYLGTYFLFLPFVAVGVWTTSRSRRERPSCSAKSSRSIWPRRSASWTRRPQTSRSERSSSS